MSTKRRIIRRDKKKDHRITPRAIALFKQVLLSDDEKLRYQIETELNFELGFQTWNVPYSRQPTDWYINDAMLPRQLEKIVAAVLAPDA